MFTPTLPPGCLKNCGWREGDQGVHSQAVTMQDLLCYLTLPQDIPCYTTQHNTLNTQHCFMKNRKNIILAGQPGGQLWSPSIVYEPVSQREVEPTKLMEKYYFTVRLTMNTATTAFGFYTSIREAKQAKAELCHAQTQV